MNINGIDSKSRYDYRKVAMSGPDTPKQNAHLMGIKKFDPMSKEDKYKQSTIMKRFRA